MWKFKNKLHDQKRSIHVKIIPSPLMNSRHDFSIAISNLYIIHRRFAKPQERSSRRGLIRKIFFPSGVALNSFRTVIKCVIVIPIHAENLTNP